jgi:Holliday junction resolvase RusA-like endonuclease
MKAVTAEYIREIKDRYKPAMLYAIDRNPRYNRMLVLSIPGVPISDSRPRFVFKTKTFFNPHKEQLMKIFQALYESDALLRSMYIYTPVKIQMTYYMPIPKSITGEMRELAEKSLLEPCTVKDNDNIEKVHWDVLQEFIMFDDKLIISNHTEKKFGTDPRIDISIYYNTEFQYSYHRDVLMRSKKFKEHLLFNFCMRKIETKEQMETHIKFILSIRDEIKLKRDEMGESLSKMTNEQLKWLLEIYKLKVGGTKGERVARIQTELNKLIKK